MTYPMPANNHRPRREIVATDVAGFPDSAAAAGVPQGWSDVAVEAMSVSAIDLQYDPDDPSDAALVITLAGTSRSVDCEYTLTEMKSWWLRNGLAAQHAAVDQARTGAQRVDDGQTEPTGLVVANISVGAHLSVGAVEIRYSAADPSDAALAAVITCDGVDAVDIEYPLTEVKATRLRNAAANQYLAVCELQGVEGNDGVEVASWESSDAETDPDNELGDTSSDDAEGSDAQRSRIAAIKDPLNLNTLIASHAEGSEIRGIPVGKLLFWGLLALFAISAAIGLVSILLG